MIFNALKRLHQTYKTRKINIFAMVVLCVTCAHFYHVYYVLLYGSMAHSKSSSKLVKMPGALFGEESYKMAAASISKKFAERGKDDPKEIDSSIKNKWNWAWCDKVLFEGTADQHLVGDCFRKLLEPGAAWCLWCNDKIQYMPV